MNPFKDLIAKKGIVLGGNVLASVFSFILTAIAIRAAGPENYGAFAVIGSLVSFLYGLSPMGLDYRYKRNFPSDFLDPNNRWTAFAPQFFAQLFFAVLFGCLCLAISPQIAAVFHIGRMPVWAIPSYLICYVFYGQCTDYFRYSLRIIPTTAMSTGLVLMQIAITGLFWKLKGELTLSDLFLSLLVALIVTFVPAIVKIRREVKPRYYRSTRAQLKSDFKLGYPVTVGFVLDHLLNSSGRYALAAMVSVAAVAHYNAAFLIASTALLLPRASTVVLQPLMSKYFDDGSMQSAASLLIWTTRLYFIIAIPFVVGAFFLEKAMLTVLATAEVAAQGEYVLPLLSAGYVCYGLITIWNNALFVSRKTQSMLRINVTAAGLSVVLTCVGLYFWRSITMAATSFFICYLFSCLVMLWSLDEKWGIRAAFSSLPRILLASGIMGITLFVLAPLLADLKPVVSLALLVLVGVAVYAGLIRSFGLLKQFAAL